MFTLRSSRFLLTFVLLSVSQMLYAQTPGAQLQGVRNQTLQSQVFRGQVSQGQTLEAVQLSPEDLQTLLQDPEFALFEPVESNASTSRGDIGAAREQPMASPAFTMVGISRIGSRQNVTLATSEGQVLRIAMTPGAAAEIPGFPGYRLVEAGPRSVAMAMPVGTPCTASQDRGVGCTANGIMQLSLVTGSPVAAPVNTRDAAVEGRERMEAAFSRGDVQGAGLEDNPFAAALRAAAEAQGLQGDAAAGQGQTRADQIVRLRGQQRRIAPEEVPPGMRIVRTPFGDRLVEQ